MYRSLFVGLLLSSVVGTPARGALPAVAAKPGGQKLTPLIFDVNHDHRVSATAGIGVDLNGDGRPDGAATGGDKMLAMSDLNNNKKIDGAEVFGTGTISPFTKRPLNARNGFEALRMIATEASQASGSALTAGGKIDMQGLANALKKSGVTLGFISDSNVVTVEALRDVKYVSLRYTESNSSGTPAHRQLGQFESSSGSFPVDDVWF